MLRLFVQQNQRCLFFGWRAVTQLVALWLPFCLCALAQSSTSPVNANAPLSSRATHLLGLQNTKSNCNGLLSIEGNQLQFQQDGKPRVEVQISSIREVFLNEENKQVGGLPMTLGKAAAPYGAGRVVSLFAHKNYDILTLEYVDADGGVHGVIFQLSEGQGDLVRNELVARGVSSSGENQSTKQSTAGVTNENK